MGAMDYMLRPDMHPTPLYDSSVATTRDYWRERMGMADAMGDERPLAEVVGMDVLDDYYRERARKYGRPPNVPDIVVPRRICDATHDIHFYVGVPLDG